MSVASPVAIVVPMLNEAAALPALIANLGALDPPPAQLIAVDGGSADGTAALAAAAGFTVLTAAPGRARQANAGVAAASAPLVCVLHADTALPSDAIAVIAAALAEPRTALAGFTAVLTGDKLRWATTAHNWLKTWYAPLLFRPHLFMRGGRLLFGDHAMHFRRADFHAVGGFDESLRIMEDADLCVRLTRLGRVRLLPRTVRTSDRRVAAWGPLKANWIYLKVGIAWGLGRRATLGANYPDVR